MNDTTTNGRVASGVAPAGAAPGATRPPIASIVHE